MAEQTCTTCRAFYTVIRTPHPPSNNTIMYDMTENRAQAGKENNTFAWDFVDKAGTSSVTPVPKRIYVSIPATDMRCSVQGDVA